MKLFNFFPVLLLTLFCFNVSMAQKGTIRGTVIDDETGEPMFSVTVVIKGTTNGAVTDFDGKFEISADPGVYDLTASFVSYQTIEITGMEVLADEVTLIDQLRMRSDVTELETVVVTAELIKTSEQALLTVKRKSANLLDGISSASFRKIGDSDAAGAAKRITGVSIEGGKYIYVRGLGDRYTKTMLNVVDIPGLDPDRNSLQIDIFPTNLLNNMIILKTATAENPADFTGGLANIETKDFPEERIFDVSFGISYNPSMHFRSDALTYEGSSTDWLGYDTDLRQLPAEVDNRNLPEVFVNPDEEVLRTSKLFSQNLAAEEATNLMNYNLGISFGDQKKVGANSIGYILSGTYKTDNEFYRDVFYGEYQKRNESDIFEMGTATTRTGAYATESVLMGGLAGLAFKTQASKFRVSVMSLQNGEKKTARLRTVSDPGDDDFDPRLISDYVSDVNNLEYFQRNLTNVLLHGEHHLGGDVWKLDWKLSPTFSSLTDPDIRRSAFSIETGRNLINPGAAGPPTRIWRFLDEVNYVGKIDITRNAQTFGRDAKFKFGTSYVAKEREYSIQAVDIIGVQQSTSWPDDVTFDDIVSDENLFPADGGNRIYYRRNGIVNPNSNAYESNNTNLAAYVSVEVSPAERLKTILGVRMEKFRQNHTGRDQTAASIINSEFESGGNVEQTIQDIKNGILPGNVLDDDVVLDATDFFPSLNTIFSLTDDQNLRFSYSRTIARPSFKELSFAQILDPVSNRTFNGGFFEYTDVDGNVIWDGDLTETRIDNLDLRWELFGKGGELLSVSAFYKSFDSPIELVRITTSQTGNEFQPRNVGNGQVIGAEFEFRKRLDFISSTLQNFSTYGNLTVVDSRIDMTSIEFNSRLVYEKDGETIEDTRDMAGQAPYVINFGLQYDNPERLLDAGLFYNVKGRTLTIVGEGFFPDIYSEPFHSLNFNLNKTFGPRENITANFSVSNILNDKREEFFRSFNANDQIFNQIAPGTEIGLGLKYSF
jgi:TonB-dependent receptor